MQPQPYAILTLAFLSWSCSSSEHAGPTESGDDAGNDTLAEPPDATVVDVNVIDRPNLAQVFPTNPIATPDLVTVDLPGVADDATGTLTSAVDAAGVRKLRVLRDLQTKSWSVV